MRVELNKDQSTKLSFSALVAAVSSKWRETAAADRSQFEAQAKVDFQRYSDEMKAYRLRPEIQGHLAAESGSGAKRRCKFVGVTKRPLSGYNIFFREEHARIKRAKDGDGALPESEGPALMTATIAKRWSELGAEAKEELNKRAAESQRASETADSLRESVRFSAELASANTPPLSLS